MFQHFFVPLDGSARAEKAIPLAAKLARASKGTLVLARVIVPPAAEGYESNIIANEARVVLEKDITEARHYMETVGERYKQELGNLQVVLDVAPSTEGTSSTLLSVAHQEHTDLIIICSRGGSQLQRWIMGSIAQNMMRRSALPVLVLNDHAPVFVLNDPARALRVLVALDGTPFSESVLQSVAQFLTLFPTTRPHEVHLLRVVTGLSALGSFGSEAYAMVVEQKAAVQRAESYLQEVAQRLLQEDGGTRFVVTTEVVTHTDPARTILDQVRPIGQQASYDLIALATHGRSGVKRVLLGSVTEKVFSATTLPLYVVAPALAEAQEQTEAKAGQTWEEIVTSGWSNLL